MELSLVTALLFVALATINSIADAAKPHRQYATTEVNMMSAARRRTTMLKAMNKIGVAALVLLLCVAGRARAQDVDAKSKVLQGNPVMVSSNPISEKTGVFTDTTVRVAFSKQMNCHSFSGATVNGRMLAEFGRITHAQADSPTQMPKSARSTAPDAAVKQSPAATTKTTS